MKNYLTILVVMSSLWGFSQKQGNIWYFGDHAGLDFNNNPPIPLLNGQTDFPSPNKWNEGCSSICDSTGSLLFYTNGMKIWNKLQQVMPNGNNLMGHSSATQSSIIVPQPGSSRYFYVFTTDASENSFQNGLRYSVVDMCVDNGLGDVLLAKKNIKIADTVTEKLISIPHANGNDFWIIVHKNNSDGFYSFRLTSLGMVDTIISHTGTIDMNVSGMTGGQMIASSNGLKIGYAKPSALNGFTLLLDFNTSTGIVSNEQVLNTLNTEYAVSFSPDNTKLYFSTVGHGEIYQYNLNAGILSAIIASKTYILQNGPDGYGEMQLAPDGKIYVSRSGKKYLSAILYPDSLCPICNYIDSAIYLGGQNASFGLPNFISNYDYSNTICNCPLAATTTSIGSQCNNQCNGSATVTASGGTGPFSYNWSNGQIAQTAVGLCAGNYVVTVSDAAAVTTTTAVTITQPSEIAIAAFVTTNTCSGSSTGRAVVNATGGTPGYAYSWSNGQVTQTASGLSAGLHTVTVTDANGCVGTDSVTISVFLPPTVTITGNTTVCSGQNVALTASGGQTYIWNTGDTTNLLTQPVFSNSAYSVTVTDVNGCSATGTAAVTANPVPVITVTGGGTIIQGQATQLVASGAGTFLWTPDTDLSCTSCNNPFASPKVKTTYCVLFADSNNCTDTACVTIDINCGEIFIPSVFSPNNDGKNDVEYVRGKCIRSLYFAIYDRWGEKVFETTDQAIGWDGVFSGKPCSNDVYTYYCNITMTDGSVVSRKGTVTLTR